jgi:hypothetical protein
MQLAGHDSFRDRSTFSIIPKKRNTVKENENLFNDGSTDENWV